MQSEYIGNSVRWMRPWNRSTNGTLRGGGAVSGWLFILSKSHSFPICQPPHSPPALESPARRTHVPAHSRLTHLTHPPQSSRRQLLGKPWEPALLSLPGPLLPSPQPVLGHVGCSWPLLLYNSCALLIDFQILVQAAYVFLPSVKLILIGSCETSHSSVSFHRTLI